MIDENWAKRFAAEWIEAWNSHDLGRILSHYAEDFVMASPHIVGRMNEPTGTLRGKEKIRAYWEIGLAAQPPIRFELIDVFAGVDSITIVYKSLSRRMAAEVLVFNERLEVVRGMAHYGRPA